MKKKKTPSKFPRPARDGQPLPKKLVTELEQLDELISSRALTTLAPTCAGCNGAKVQQDKNTAIKHLCPVCQGSGIMPPAPGVPASTPAYPDAGRYFQPYPSPYPWYPQDTGGGSGTRPYRDLPNQIID